MAVVASPLTVSVTSTVSPPRLLRSPALRRTTSAFLSILWPHLHLFGTDSSLLTRAGKTLDPFFSRHTKKGLLRT